MRPKFCPRCGEPINDNFKFCKKCGNPLPLDGASSTPYVQTPTSTSSNDSEKTVMLDQSDARSAVVQSRSAQQTPPVQPQSAQVPPPVQPQSAQVPPPVQPPVQPPIQPQPRPMPQPQPRPMPVQPAPKKSGSGLQKIIIILLIFILLVVIGVGVFLAFDAINGKDERDDDSKRDSIPSKDQSNHTYELVKDDISWEDAAKKAEKKGGYLACIQDEDEEKEIIDYLNQSGDLKVVYIGGKRDGGSFEWISGERFVYTDWSPGEPNNTDYMEDYMCLYNSDTHSSWGWNDCTNDMYQDYDGQFTGYTAYLIEYDND